LALSPIPGLDGEKAGQYLEKSYAMAFWSIHFVISHQIHKQKNFDFLSTQVKKSLGSFYFVYMYSKSIPPPSEPQDPASNSLSPLFSLSPTLWHSFAPALARPNTKSPDNRHDAEQDFLTLHPLTQTCNDSEQYS
jgi:hypothetical protein